MPKLPACPEDELVSRPGFPGYGWMSGYLQVLAKAQHLSASSRRTYESVWRAYLVFLAKRGLRAPHASSEHAAAFLRQHQRSTALRYGRLLGRVYEQAQATRKTAANPFSALQSVLAAQEERQPSVALALPNVADLIQRLPEPEDWQEHRDQAAVVLSVSAGLRLRELRELEVVQFVPRSTGLEVQPRGRTVRSREVLLDPAAAAFMQNWLRVRTSLAFARPTQIAFPGRKGQALPVNTFYRRVRRLLLEIYGEGALPRFGTGVLRATFAQQYRTEDQVVQAQHALGHRRITSTLRFFRHLKPIAPKI